jgi:hypothetical protein
LVETSVSPLKAQKIRLTIAWVEQGATREIAVERQILLWRDPR